ncbi:MAG: hypothetical protein HKO59_14535 [Phycisphaerales bacterium]|nr:hypothetical protein [Phycisphaerae bacterium]NNF42706.1 hypothetical protein [Phycisphaerales bacterium]NNM27178.1 hypothetical protein [Phycisphaerales bacterium]
MTPPMPPMPPRQRRQSLMIGASAFIAMLTLTIAAPAQNQPGRNTGQPTQSSTNEPLNRSTGGNDATTGERQNQNQNQDDGRDRTNRRSGNERGTGVNERGGANDRDANKLAREIAKEEAKYRKRIAKINRLLQIANERGNPNLANNANRLRQRINRVHERKLAKIRNKHGEGAYQKATNRVKRADANRKQKNANDRANRGGVNGRNDDTNAGRDGANPSTSNESKKPNNRRGRNRNANQGG